MGEVLIAVLLAIVGGFGMGWSMGFVCGHRAASRQDKSALKS